MPVSVYRSPSNVDGSVRRGGPAPIVTRLGSVQHSIGCGRARNQILASSWQAELFPDRAIVSCVCVEDVKNNSGQGGTARHEQLAAEIIDTSIRYKFIFARSSLIFIKVD